ncbi:MAG: SRPBCC family protein [Labilithrix sp.]|nr:SRPBCC family protein [Labilithrix sp.]
MPFVARAERKVDVPPERAFDQLADLASWPSWMPRSFCAVGVASRAALKTGDRLRVRIAGAPVASSLRVTVSDRPRELAWRGGVRGLVWAEHRFVFERDGEGTRVQSIETWHGPLARLGKAIIAPLATRVGGEQLDALARAVAG